MAETLRLRALVQGRVQGVGYRFFAQDHALALGLQGYVRNLPGGSGVEVVAEGGQPALDAFLARLRRGPPGAWVERIDAEWAPASGEYGDFLVRA